ncbi:uncharacterized protein LOC124847464 [Vigna umbellata]|uniref:uncharacterized protein LOC124847464 n=1 Tax=Vigna umbellata TaxID=87088 RepID=UPI001F5FAD0A|nr:uncharacterized protein LOC124847464 [Vigna umbellata]
MPISTGLFSRRNPYLFLKTPRRLIASQAQAQAQAQPSIKPLRVLFDEAIGHSKKSITSDSDEERTESKSATELKNNLKQLEQDIKTFKEKTSGIPKRMTLFAAFTNKQPPTKPKENKQPPTKPKEPVIVKELSPDMKMFAQHLFEKGYFKDANFSQSKKKFDHGWFTSFYALGYIKFAAQRFARDNQEIAKWLSGSALKQVATFGCSHTSNSAVFPAKRLRKFFEVPENTVCCKCTLQQTCKFRNQSVWNVSTNNLELVTVMKVITSYGLESVHPQLVVPDVVKKSVSQLLKEIVKLSPTT